MVEFNGGTFSGNMDLYGGQLINNGTLTWTVNQMRTGNGSIINNLANGIINLTPNSVVSADFGGTYVFNNAGQVTMTGPGTARIDDTFNNSGTVSVQSGTLALSGSYNLTNGILNFGITSLTDYGRINLAGSATLTGTVSANLNNGYVPVAGNSFAVLSYGDEDGIFTNQNLPLAVTWQTNYSATIFSLQVLTVNPGAMSQLVMNPTTIASATAGTSVSGSFTSITAEDANGNVCSSGPNDFNGTVTFGGTAGASGTSAAFTHGVLNGFPALTPTVAGSSKTITATSGSVVGTTTITTVTKATPAITGVTSQSMTYGTASLALSGTVSATGGVYPAIGESGTVSATINGHTVTGMFNTSSGGFSINYNDASLATNGVGGSAYPITYAYTGDANLNAAANNTGTTLTINKATPTLSVENSPVTYNGSAQAASVSAGSVAGNVSNLKYNGSDTAPTDVGAYAITADFAPTNSTDYNSLSGASAGSFDVLTALSGTSESAGLPGFTAGTIPVTFVAKASDGTTVLGSNVVVVATANSGQSFTFTVGVPGGTATVSLKPRFYLRKRFTAPANIGTDNTVDARYDRDLLHGRGCGW